MSRPSEDGWRRWAPTLERLRPRPTWPAGDLPGSGLVYLFADGFYSTSTTHWLNTIEPELEKAKCQGQARGFSYAGRGLPYETEHTRLSLSTATTRYHSYLERGADEFVLVGFSLGAVVTLLAMQEWLRAGSSLHPHNRVRAVVLVAPAHAVSPHLLHSYRAWTATSPPGEPRRTPFIVQQLGSSTSPTRRAARQAFATIVGAGIPLYVLYWEHDAFTPYERPIVGATANQLHEIPVRREANLPDLRFAVSEHMRIRDHQTTMASLVQLLCSL